MAYRYLVLPNGQIEKIPENMSDEEAYAALGVDTPAAPAPRGGLWSGVKRGVGHLVEAYGSTMQDLSSTVRTAIPTLGAVASTDTVRRGAIDVEKYGRSVSEANPPKYASSRDVKSLGDVPGFIGERVAEMAPFLGAGFLGGPAGAAIVSGVQTYGDARTSQREKGIDDRAGAALAGVGVGALDAYTGVGRIFGIGGGVRKTADNLLRRTTRGVLEEGITEPVQSVMERAAAHKSLTDAEALEEYRESLIVGGLIGGTLNAAAHPLARKREEQEDDLGPIPADQPTNLLRLPPPTKYVDPTGVVTDSLDQAIQVQNAPREVGQVPMPEAMAELPIGAQPDLFGAQPQVPPEEQAPTDQGGQAPLDLSNPPQPLGPSLFDDAPAATVRSGYSPREVRWALTGGSKPDAFIMKMSTALTRAFADGNINTARKAIDSEFDRLAKPGNKLMPETVDHRLQVLDRANNLVETYNSEFVGALAEEGQIKAQPGAKVGPALEDKSGAIAQELELNAQTKAVEEPKLRKQLMERALTTPNIENRDKYYEALLKRNNLDPTITDEEFEEIYRTQEAIDVEQAGNLGAAPLEAAIPPQRKRDVAAALNIPGMAAAETKRAVQTAEETAQGNEARSSAKRAKERAEAEAAQEVTKVAPGEARGLRENARLYPLAEREVVEEAGDLDQRQVEQQQIYRDIGEARASNTITDSEQALLTNMIRRGAPNEVVKQAIKDLQQQRKREARKTRQRALEGREPRSAERADRRAKESPLSAEEQQRVREADAVRETNIDLQEQQPRKAQFPQRSSPPSDAPRVQDLTTPEALEKEIAYLDRVRTAVRTHNLMGALREIAANDNSPIRRWVAQVLVDAGVNVHIEAVPRSEMPDDDINGFTNFWVSGTLEIVVNEEDINPGLVLHEAIHAALIGRIGTFERPVTDEELRRLGRPMQEAVFDLIETWHKTQRLILAKFDDGEHDAWVAESVRSLDEFLAYVPTDLGAQKWLAGHDLQGRPVPLEKSIWMKMMDAIRRFFGQPPKFTSALDEIMRAQGRVFSEIKDLPLNMLTMSAQLQRLRAERQRGFARRNQITGRDGSPVFFSGAAQALRNHPQQKGPATQWLNMLKPGRLPGAKEEELEWSGVREWLQGLEGTMVDKDDLVAFLENNGIEVEEVVLGELPDGLGDWVVEPQQRPFRRLSLGGWSTAGGATDQILWQVRNPTTDQTYYNFTSEQSARDYARSAYVNEAGTRWNRWTSDPHNEGYRELMLRMPPGVKNNPTSTAETHWKERGVVAHVRFMPKKNAAGRDVIYLEEVQSDWHQQGRKNGYDGQARDPAVVARLEAAVAAKEHELVEMDEAISRYVKAQFGRELSGSAAAGWLDEHAEGLSEEYDDLRQDLEWGFYRGGRNESTLGDEATLTREELQAQLENLKKVINDSRRLLNAQGELEFQLAELLTQRSGANFVPNAPFKKGWPELVLKRMVRWAVDNGYEEIAWIKGDEQNGATGSAAGGWFYDRNLPNIVNDLFKKYGVKVETLHIVKHPIGRGREDVVEPHLGFRITPALREQASQGFPLFQRDKAGINRRDFLRGATAVAGGWMLGGKLYAKPPGLVDTLRASLDRGVPLNNALSWIAENSASPAFQRLARRLMPLTQGVTLRTVTPEKVGVAGGGMTVWDGMYQGSDGAVPPQYISMGLAHGQFQTADNGEDQVWLAKTNADAELDGWNERTIMHEALHAAIIRYYGMLSLRAVNEPDLLRRSGLNRAAFPRSAPAEAAVLEIATIWTEASKAYEAFGDKVAAGKATPMSRTVANKISNALENPDELVSWASEDIDVQNFMKTMKSKNDPRSLWERLVNAIARIFGGGTNRTLLNDLLDARNRLLDEVQGLPPVPPSPRERNGGERMALPQRANPSRINAVPATAGRAVADFVGGKPTRWTAALDFGWGLADRIAKLGVHSARVYQRLIDERTAIAESVEKNYVELSEKFDRLAKLPGQLTGRRKGSLNWLARHMVFEGKWAFEPTWLRDERGRQVRVQVDPEYAAMFNRLPVAARAVLEDMFRLPHETLHRKRKAISEFLEKEHSVALDKAQAEYDQALAAGIADQDRIRDLANKVRRARKNREADFERFHRLFNVNLSEPYMPIRRFGDFVVVGRSAEFLAEEQNARTTGDDTRLVEMKSDPAHYYVDFAETELEASRMRRRVENTLGLQAVKFTKEQAREQLVGGRDMFHAFGRLRDLLKNTMPGKDGEKLDNMVVDLMIASLISASSRKSEMARLKVAGGDFDMMRGAISQGRADAQFVSAVHKNSEITDALARMREEVKFQNGERDPDGFEARQSLFNEITMRHAMSMEPPRQSWIADRATAMTSIWMLMLAPGFYLQQATQPAIMSVPAAAGRHGYASAWKEMMRGYKRVHEAWQDTGLTGSLNLDQLPPEYRAMAYFLSDRGRLDIGINKDMGNWSSDGRGAFNDVMFNVVQKLRGLTRKAEAINRLATAVMEYNLQLKKPRIQPIHDDAAYSSYLKDAREAYPNLTPMTEREFAAANHAIRLVDETHGNYEIAAAPRFMRGNVGRIVTQFKKFQLMQGRLYARSIYEGFFDKSLPRAERVAARQTLMFMTGHAFVSAGLKGLPGATSLLWLFEALKDLFDDDDEPTNLERDFREAVQDPALADMLLHGTPTLGGLNLQGSIGQGNMLSLAPYADSPIDKDPRDAKKTAQAYITQAMGPLIGGQVPGWAQGLSFMRDGQYQRGIEQLLPRGPQQAMRSFREAQSGIPSLAGEMRVRPEDLSARELIFSAFGLQPVERSRRQFVMDNRIRDEEFFDGKSTKLRRMYANATTPAEKADIRQEWNEHQQARVKAGFKRQPVSSLLRIERDRRRTVYGPSGPYARGEAERMKDLEELAGLEDEE